MKTAGTLALKASHHEINQKSKARVTNDKESEGRLRAHLSHFELWRELPVDSPNSVKTFSSLLHTIIKPLETAEQIVKQKSTVFVGRGQLHRLHFSANLSRSLSHQFRLLQEERCRWKQLLTGGRWIEGKEKLSVRTDRLWKWRNDKQRPLDGTLCSWCVRESCTPHWANWEKRSLRKMPTTYGQWAKRQSTPFPRSKIKTSDGTYTNQNDRERPIAAPLGRFIRYEGENTWKIRQEREKDSSRRIEIHSLHDCWLAVWLVDKNLAERKTPDNNFNSHSLGGVAPQRNEVGEQRGKKVKKISTFEERVKVTYQISQSQ